jgi:hypothetical protein
MALLWQRLRAGFCRGAERPAGVELGELERGLLTSTGVSAASDVDDVRVAAEAARVAYTDAAKRALIEHASFGCRSSKPQDNGPGLPLSALPGAAERLAGASFAQVVAFSSTPLTPPQCEEGEESVGGVDLSEVKLDVRGYIALMLTGPHAWRLSLEDALELVTVYEALAPRVRLTTVLLPFNAAKINTLAHSMGLWPWAGSRSVGETICALFPGTGFPDFAAWWVQHSMRLTAAAGGQATHKGPETMLIDDLRARARGPARHVQRGRRRRRRTWRRSRHSRCGGRCPRGA